MARYSGKVGYAVFVKTKPGVTEDTVVEHQAYGEVLRPSKNLEENGTVNGQTNLGTSLRIVANQHALDNSDAIRYAWFKGRRWTVSKVTEEVDAPRLVLQLGEKYNGKTP